MMPGLDEANAELDRMIAEDAAAAGKAGAGKTDEASADEAQRAEQAAGDDQAGKSNDDAAAKAAAGKSDDATQASAEAAKAAEDAKKAEAAKAAAAKPGDEKKSRFGKAQERLQGGWSELNANKTALQTEQEAFKKQQAAEREQLKLEREEFEAQRNQAEQEFTPEKYEAAAKKFEADGKFDLADLAKQKAEQLRKNPPQKAADKNAAASKEWAMKAGTDYPELTKKNSPLQVRVSQLLIDEPEFKAHPKGIYVAARIADLENQAASGKAALARVAEKDVELGKLKERISELEKLTAPGGGDGVTRLPGTKSFAEKSSDEQYAELSQELAGQTL